MATRSNIAIKTPVEGKPGIYRFRQIYEHWDGYPEYLGKVLKNYFSSTESVNKLIDGGDISSIDDDGKVNYYKDMGEDFERFKPEEYISKKFRPYGGAEYIYIWNTEDNFWEVHETNFFGD